MADAARDKLSAGGLAAIPLTILFTAFIGAVYAFGVYLFPALMTQMLPSYSMSYSEAGSVMAASQLGSSWLPW